MNPLFWYGVIQVVAIVAYVVSILFLVLVAAGAIWVSRKLAKSLGSIAESLEETKKSINALPEMVAKVEKVTAELHDLQEGEVRVLQHVEKAIKDLIGTIDEFEGMVFKPKERPQRVQATNESAEMVAERRRLEHAGAGAVDLERLQEVGKNVGTV